MNIVNVGYASTNYYAIDINSGKLLVDCGWPGTLPQFSKVLQRKGIALHEIKYLIITHLHPDHAGLAQELKNQGIKFIRQPQLPGWHRAERRNPPYAWAQRRQHHPGPGRWFCLHRRSAPGFLQQRRFSTARELG